MKRLILILLMLAPALVSAQTDGPFFGALGGSGVSPVTFTLRGTPSQGHSGTSSIAVTLNQSIVAGDAVIWQCTSGPGIWISSVSNTGTLVPIKAGFGAVTQGGQTSESWMWPAVAESTTDTVTLTPGSNYGECIVYDYAVTGTPQLDGANANQVIGSSTTFGTPLFTPSSGSNNDLDTRMSMVFYQSPASISSPFTFVSPAADGGWAHHDSGVTAYSPTWTFSGAQTYWAGAQAELGGNVTPFSNMMFTGFSGTNGGTPTVATLTADTHGFQSHWFVNAGSCVFTYNTAASAPLTGSTGRLNDGSSYTDSSTTGIELAGSSGAHNCDLQFGADSPGLISTGEITAGVNVETNVPGTTGVAIDAVVIYGFNFSGTPDFINAMIFGNGTTTGIQLECTTQNNHGFYGISLNTFYHLDEIFNQPWAISTTSTAYSVTAGTMTLTVSPAIAYVSSQVIKITATGGDALFPLNGQTFAITGGTLSSTITFAESGVTGSGLTSAAVLTGQHTLKIYTGWASPSSPGTLVSTATCPSMGFPPSDLTLGNSNSSAVPASYFVYFDTPLVSLDGADPL